MLLLISQWNLAIFTSINVKNDPVSLSSECLSIIAYMCANYPARYMSHALKGRILVLFSYAFGHKNLNIVFFLILHQLSDTDCAKNTCSSLIIMHFRTIPFSSNLKANGEEAQFHLKLCVFNW